MPQPITRLRMRSSTPEIILDRPELAAHIAYIAVLYAHLDLGLGMLLAEILGAEFQPAIDMFLALRGGKEDAIKAAAIKRLTAEQFGKLEEILKLYKTRGGDRANLVHCI
jgi:fructose-1,6-bisphosphatase/sedoheptulose 1,7-bisphosphatase-like protein